MAATRDGALADAEQLIADLQRQLAERTAERDAGLAREAAVAAERDEGLARETATVEILQVINSSSVDLSPVFEAILDKAHSLCDVAQGGLALYDGEYFRGVAAHGHTEPLADVTRPPPFLERLFRGNVFHQRLVNGEPYVHVPDLLSVAEQLSDGVGRAGIEAGFHTWLGIPLRKDGKFFGFISAARPEVRPFSEKQIALLQNFAAQAVIAIENAR